MHIYTPALKKIVFDMLSYDTLNEAIIYSFIVFIV